MTRELGLVRELQHLYDKSCSEDSGGDDPQRSARTVGHGRGCGLDPGRNEEPLKEFMIPVFPKDTARSQNGCFQRR